jgi:RimJ/RimL family protein N-acetyltransferase
MPVVVTERLILRPFEPRDLDAFTAICADPEVMTFFPSVLDRAAVATMFERLDDRRRRLGLAFGAAERRADGVLVGMIGLHPVVGLGVPFEPAIEIGWRLGRAYWGGGYATEGARALLRFGFETLGLGEVVAMAVGANRRSLAVMERLGMRRDPDGDFDHPRVPAGPLRRHVLYRIDAAAFAAP